jgi:hypothetical protein
VRIDPDERSIVLVYESLREVAHVWNVQAGSDFYDDGTAHPFQPALAAQGLGCLVFGDPIPVIEHQHVWPGYTATMWTNRQLSYELAAAYVDHRIERVGCPGIGRAGGLALEVMERAMALLDVQAIEARFLEQAVYIAGMDEDAVL